MNNSIISTNNECQLHGYQEVYWVYCSLLIKSLYNNGIQIGYEECYNNINGFSKKSFYI